MLRIASSTDIVAGERSPAQHIVIIGRTYAGKSMTGRIMASLLGFEHIEASEVLSEQIPGGAVGPDEIDPEVILDFVKSEGYRGVAPYIVTRLEEQDISNSVITGPRTPQEVELLKDELPDVIIITIQATLVSRFIRAQENNHTVGEAILEFRRKETLDEKLGLSRTLDQFGDIELVNEHHKSEFIHALIRLSTDLKLSQSDM